MESQSHQMIPIWFIIGINLLVYGVVIFITGLVDWNHPDPNVAMTELHADVWWGGFMLLLGLFYSIRFLPKKNS